MDYNKQHPLSQITCGNSLSMLEMLIPYVDYPFKLPLALLIKFLEIRMIINTFHNTDSLERLGLHNKDNNPIDILCSLTGIPPDMLHMLMSMPENNFSGMDFPFGNTNPFQEFDANSHLNDNSFDDRINQIFAEYDNKI